MTINRVEHYAYGLIPLAPKPVPARTEARVEAFLDEHGHVGEYKMEVVTPYVVKLSWVDWHPVTVIQSDVGTRPGDRGYHQEDTYDTHDDFVFLYRDDINAHMLIAKPSDPYEAIFNLVTGHTVLYRWTADPADPQVIEHQQ